MASDLQGLEEGRTDDYELVPNTSPTDEQLAVQALARGPGEVMTIQTLQRFRNPDLLQYLTPFIRQIADEQIELRNQEFSARMKENPANEATTSVPKRLKLQFRNKISLPVFTGKPLLGENKASIEIALVDAFTNQIMNTGIESTAKLEIVGFRVGDNGRIDDSWTFKEFQEMIMSEKKGKHILQGETCLQLKKGVCFLSKISFTHTKDNTKNGWYRLGAGVVDAALMHRVEVAKTDAFLMRDGRTIYSEKRPHPRLSDKVCHLQHISYKGDRYKRLKVAGVFTVKDLLTLVYTNPKGLQDILKVGACSNIWRDIVKNAQASNGMFLFLDLSNEEKSGVVIDAKLQLKGLIAETCKYVPVDQLSDKQKVDNKDLVKFASEHFETLQPFEDETSLREYLMSLPSANQNLGTSNMIVEAVTETPHNPNGHYPTEPRISSQAVESPVDTCGHMNNFNSEYMMDFLNNPSFPGEFGQLLGPDSILHFDWPNEDMMHLGTSSSPGVDFGYAVDGFFFPLSAIGKAQRRWKIVSSVLKWLSLMLETREREIC